MSISDPFYVELGARIRARREELGLTQAIVADEMGISRTSLTNIECGRQRLLVDQLVNLAEKLSTTPAQLLPVKLKAASASTDQEELRELPSVSSFVTSVLSGSRQ